MISTEPIHLSGWLNKKKSISRIYSTSWNRRWMSIENDMLCWRQSENRKNCRSIKLKEIEKVYALKQLKNGTKTYVFVVKSKRRTLCLMAKSSQDCMRWVKALQMQLDLRSGGTSSGPRSNKNCKQINNDGDKFEHMIKLLDKNLSTLTSISPHIEENYLNYYAEEEEKFEVQSDSQIEIENSAQDKEETQIIYFNEEDIQSFFDAESSLYQLQ